MGSSHGGFLQAGKADLMKTLGRLTSVPHVDIQLKNPLYINQAIPSPTEGLGTFSRSGDKEPDDGSVSRAR